MAVDAAPLVREMRGSDLDAVMRLERATFVTPWSPEIFRKELAAGGRTYLVAEHGGEVVGYGGLMHVGEGAHINTLAAVRPAPAPAIGTRLMLSLVDRGLRGGAEHLTLEVRSSNRSAQDFYRKFGLAPVGVRKHYYQDEDALIMWAHSIREAEYRDRIARIEAGLP